MSQPTDTSESLTINFNHAGKTHSPSFPADSTLQELAQYACDNLHVPIENQKWLISPKPGMIKPPFDDTSKPSLPLSDVVAAKKIMLMGSTAAKIASLNKSVQSGATQANRKVGDGPVKAAKPVRTRDWKTLQDEIKYTFGKIEPMQGLLHSERSRAYLQRLADDPGVKAAMIKHQFSVGLLTELDPAKNTTHESRTLGLNEGGGAVIHLRLRTDAYDGYRDYKTVRLCLCHELAHNVHGEHNRDFYDLMNQLEKEVTQNDWKHGGHALSEQEFYQSEEPPAEPEHEWVGGTRRLGSSSVGHTAGASSASADGNAAQSRREMMAKAAEERNKKQPDPGR